MGSTASWYTCTGGFSVSAADGPVRARAMVNASAARGVPRIARFVEITSSSPHTSVLKTDRILLVLGRSYKVCRSRNHARLAKQAPNRLLMPPRRSHEDQQTCHAEPW